MDTTLTGEDSREARLERWIKRTQEVLAFRSIHGLTFHRLYNLMRTKRLVEIALSNVLQNAGAKTAGIDGMTKARLDDDGRDRLIDELWQELCAKTYRPAPVRRVYIPKANGGTRPLGIPTLRDRVVQEMLRLILEPIYEAKFYRHSYGFRPFRSTHHAAVRIKDLMGTRRYNYAIEGDIRKCFDRLHHITLLRILRKTIKDERIITMIKQMLRAGCMEDGAWHVTEEGSPQGGIVSPLLANIYLNELDQFIARQWADLTDTERMRQRRRKVARPCFIVRYADDFVVMVQGTRGMAEQLKAEIATFLDQELHLELSEEKTLVTPAEQGLDFLGFHLRKYPRASLITPSRPAMDRFRRQVRQRIRTTFHGDEITAIVQLNRYINGWGMYYRHASSTRFFRSLDHFVWHAVWTATRKLRKGRKLPTARQHYKAHYIPYRYALTRTRRRRAGGHYGAWADDAHTMAYIIDQLRFIPIRYVNLHPQLNPYVPEERRRLEKKPLLTELRPTPERDDPTPRTRYGEEWELLRHELFAQAGHRCARCGQPIAGRRATVHHITPLKQSASRRQANRLENLRPLCPPCHAIEERQGT